MTYRKRNLLSVMGAMILGVGIATAENVVTDVPGPDNPGRGDGAIQPGTLEHATGAGDSDAVPPAKAKDQIALSAPVTATAEEIAQHPGQFFGKRVNVTTRIDQPVDPHFFTLEAMGKSQRPPDNQLGQAEQFDAQPVLVLIESPVRAAPAESTVTITGLVRPFVVTDVERDYSWFERDWMTQANIDTQVTPRALIVADSVMTSDGMQLVQGASTTGEMKAGDAPLPNPPAPPHREREPLSGSGTGADAIE